PTPPASRLSTARRAPLSVPLAPRLRGRGVRGEGAGHVGPPSPPVPLPAAGARGEGRHPSYGFPPPPLLALIVFTVVAPSSVIPNSRSIGEMIFARWLSMRMRQSLLTYTRSPGNTW